MEKEYRVTCKGMFHNGLIYRLGDVIKMPEDRAQAYRDKYPHYTFEEVKADDEDKRKSTGKRRKARNSGNA